MKRITEIEFVNYKAFYQSGAENKIIIPDGKSVLIYGENGSGKSSIYEGLKQFFNSSDNTIDVTPSRHIAVSKTRIENEGTESQREVSNEVAVKITFADNAGTEQRIFGVPNSNLQGTNYIAQANLLNSFLSYRELLRTYLMENPRDRTEFRLKFAQLLIEVVLSKQMNSVTLKTFQKSWDDLFIPRAWYKEDSLKKFTQGLEKEIRNINLLLPFVLNYFETGFNVQLTLTKSEIEKYYSTKSESTGKNPICEVDLKVFLNGENIENDEENHLTVLNEARLSALAISIYFASLINTPQDNYDYKILFLDDIFIGLDMSNRLPLLEILKNFKKPIIESYLDEAHDNIIIERIREVDGIKQTESVPFFKNYQTFITTYDRFWFEVAKKELETKSNGLWQYLELFSNKRDGNTFNTPLVYSSLNFLQRADYYFNKKEYPECVNNLRKALEARIKLLLPSNKHLNEYEEVVTGEKIIKPLRTLNEYLTAFIKYCSENGIDATELVDLKNLKDWYFNPFSHDNIGTPIFTRELNIAKSLVERIGNFEFSVLLPAATNLYFRFDNGSGQTREYKIELQENLRWIKSIDGNILTNPVIQCYEWTQNNIAASVSWKVNGGNPLRLVSFYNNKLNHLMHQDETHNVSMSLLWDELKQIVNDQPLSSLL